MGAVRCDLLPSNHQREKQPKIGFHLHTITHVHLRLCSAVSNKPSLSVHQGAGAAAPKRLVY